MRIVLQRVSTASVTVGGEVVSSIGPGLCILVGVAHDDRPEDAEAGAVKIAGLRVFPDGEGKMNRSLVETGGEALVVSQFTLLGDARRGRRPSFTAAAPPDLAAPLIDRMVARLEEMGVPTSQGVFGARMAVAMVNEGPVTLVLETRPASGPLDGASGPSPEPGLTPMAGDDEQGHPSGQHHEEETNRDAPSRGEVE